MENKEERIEKLNAAIDAAKKSLIMATGLLTELKSDVSSLIQTYKTLQEIQKEQNDRRKS